jgi:hypothetical protein
MQPRFIADQFGAKEIINRADNERPPRREDHRFTYLTR